MRNGAWSLNVTINGNTGTTASTFTNMPAADTFMFNTTKHVVLVDISGMTSVRFNVNKQGTAGVAGSTLTLRYSPTFSTTVGDYVDIGTSPVSVAINTTNSFLDSGWIDIDTTAIGYEDVYLAVIGSGGNGTTDPQFGSISASFA